MSERRKTGEIDLANGVKFKWMIGGETVPEVYGWLERADRTIISKSSGWFRTDDPEKAARIADGNFAEEIAASEK